MLGNASPASATDVGRFVYDFREGSAEMRDLLRRKGGDLAECKAPLGRDRETGVCGDPDSIDVFDRVGLDYGSCSPSGLPIARLAAAQATLKGGSE